MSIKYDSAININSLAKELGISNKETLMLIQRVCINKGMRWCTSGSKKISYSPLFSDVLFNRKGVMAIDFGVTDYFSDMPRNTKIIEDIKKHYLGLIIKGKHHE